MHRLKSTTAIVIAIVAVLAIGTATAARLITGKQIKNHSITGKDVKPHSIPLSALKTVPAGKPGEQGERGSPGLRGAPGEIGSPGTSALTDEFTLAGPIEEEIKPTSNLEYLGEPAKFGLFTGEGGVIEATVTVGTTESTIEADDISFGICAGEKGKAEFALDEEEEGGGEVFGTSPTIPSSERTSLTVSSPFFLEGEGEEPEGPFLVELGPCVLNESTSPLDDNSRVQGYVLISSS